MSCAQYRFGILVAVTDSMPDQLFCIKYYPELSNLTSDRSEATQYRFEDLRDLGAEDTCDPDVIGDLAGKVGLVSGSNTTGNCSIADRADVLETHHAAGLIADRSVSTKFNASEYTTANIFVTALYYPDTKQKLLDIKKSHPNSKFVVYGPEEKDREFDGSILVIFCLATFTVGLGSLWSGYTKHTL